MEHLLRYGSDLESVTVFGFHSNCSRKEGGWLGNVDARINIRFTPKIRHVLSASTFRGGGAKRTIYETIRPRGRRILKPHLGVLCVLGP